MEDLHLTERTHDFACTCLITEVLAPEPFGRVWVANHFPDYQLDTNGTGDRGRDMDADEAADRMRFWTGRHVLGDLSVCYRSAWESARPGERLMTFTPENPNSVNPDWPFRGIGHTLIRCGDSGGGKKTAPTAHAALPGVLKTAGPVAAAADEARDAVTGRGD